MKVIALTKISGNNMNRKVIHVKGGCRSSKRINQAEWTETIMEYVEWQQLALSCVECARVSPRQLEKAEK